MHNFVHEMLHNSSAAQRIEALWQVSIYILQVYSAGVYWMIRYQEYESGETAEARFVKGQLLVYTVFLLAKPYRYD